MKIVFNPVRNVFLNRYSLIIFLKLVFSQLVIIHLCKQIFIFIVRIILFPSLLNSTLSLFIFYNLWRILFSINFIITITRYDLLYLDLLIAFPSAQSIVFHNHSFENCILAPVHSIAIKTPTQAKDHAIIFDNC